MAVIKCTIGNSVGMQDRTALLVTWAAVTENDTFAPVSLPEYTSKSVQVDGTFGGSTVVLNGSNDGTQYEGLKDPANAAITGTSHYLRQVQENTVFYQPSASGGSAQSLTVTMLFVKASAPR